MRCMICGAEMTLIGVVEDDTFSLVRGFEHHTYMCSRCGDIERRLVFNKHSKEPNTEAVTILSPPPIAPALTPQNQRKTAQGLLRRVLAKIRG
jgi:DNA-directed RNA polymerase subunit RPC12/RpoP